MKTAICYYSRHHGNTRQVLEAMAREGDVELIDVTTRQTVRLERYDCIGFASGIYAFAFHPAVAEFARQYLPQGKPVFFVDTYGGYARHGGGAFSGKDCTKVDRSAAYAARWVAKNVVAAGLADRCEVELAYAIGVSKPLSIMVDTFGTAHVAEDKIVEAVEKTFDLRPGAIIRDLDLRRPIYEKTAAYGHFGREDADFTWEKTDRVEELKAACGL